MDEKYFVSCKLCLVHFSTVNPEKAILCLECHLDVIAEI